MKDENTVTFTEVIDVSVEAGICLHDSIKLDYTDPQAVELELDLCVKLKDSNGQIWTVFNEDSKPIVHLVKKD